MAEQLRAAEAFLARGRLDEAETIVAPLRQAQHPELQALFLSGMIYVARGRYEEAAAAFRTMLARDPTLLRPRLELARALYLAHDYQSARYHFEQALAAALPDTVRENVLAYISAIRNRVPSFVMSLDIVSDSNPKQATSSRYVEIGGQTFRLNDDARAQEGYGLVATLQGKLPLPSDPTWYLAGFGELYDYSARDLDQLYLQALGGKHFPGTKHEFNLEAGVHYGAYQGKSLYQGAAARLGYAVRLRPSVLLTAMLDTREFDYVDYTYLSGWQFAQNVELRYAISTDRSVRPSLFFIQHDADEAPYAYDAIGMGLRYIQEWKGGWIAGLYAQYGASKYRDADILAGVTRHDVEWRAELTLTNRLLTLRGFAPRLALGAVERTSNIDLYTFDRRYVRVGFTREF